MNEEKILTRMCYQHISGAVYYCVAIAAPVKATDKKQVILTSLENGSVWTTPVDTFFDLHPDTKVPRFELVTPVVKVLSKP